MGARGSQSSSSGSSVSLDEAMSQSRSFVDPTQQPFLQGLYSAGQQQLGRSMRDAQGTVPQLQRTFGNIGLLTDPSAQIAAQSASLQAGLGSLFRDEINPAIQTDAIAAGGLGGGRQGVAEGVAAGQLADAFTQGYGDIVASANATSTQAAGLMPALGQSISNAGFGPLAAYADILGAPTIIDERLSRAVGQSRSSQRSSSDSFGFSLV